MLDAGGNRCSVLLAEIDGDDAALTAGAESLQRASRDADLAAHLDKGELALLLTDVDRRAAAEIGERIGEALRQNTVAMSWADSYCQRMLGGRISSTVPDLANDPQTRTLALTTELGLRAYAGVPVRPGSGETYGTQCGVDTRPHPELNERHAELLGFLGELAAELIDDEAELPEARRALASAVAARLGLDPAATRDVERVALLHDIGKVGIPDAILQKQGPLDDDEWTLMRQHPVVGQHIIAGTPGLSHLAPAVRAEHERWDGAGYPDGLAGEHIHVPLSESPTRPRPVATAPAGA